MDLKEILSKTKKRSEQIKIVRKPPSIASTDRPYSAFDMLEEKHQPNETNNVAYTETDNKPTTNRQQTGNKLATNWQQTDNKKVILKETGNKLATEPTTNWQQTGNKLATKTSFSMLIGLQRACLLFVYQSCKANRSKVTEPLSLEHISQHLKTSSGAVKTTLQRLVEKNCLTRISFKNGRGGWSTYELPESIFTEMLRQETDNKLATNWQQTGNKLATEPATNVASSSSYYNKETTTTSDTSDKPNLGEEWQSIDIEPLAEFGFTQAHLTQVADQGKLNTEIVQKSIYAFAFDLKRNNKTTVLKTNPVNYFMGILRNGKPYAPPSNYESPQDEALRLYVEKQKELEEKRRKLEEKAIELSFSQWITTLSSEDKNKLISPFAKNLKSEVPKLAELKNHFIQTIWPAQREQIIKPAVNHNTEQP